MRYITLWNKRISFADLAVFIFLIVYTTAAVLVCLHRFWQYEVFYYDFGIFDQAIWKVSRFKAPIIEHFAVGGKWIFADHFNPSIFLLSPLYWLTDKSEILIIAQSTVVGLSGLYIYLIGKELIKSRLLSFAVSFSYLTFIGLQNALIADFHEVTIMILLLVLAYYAVVKNKKNWFIIFFLITLGFKESTFLLGIGIAISLFLIKRSWRKLSVSLILISVLWGFTATKVIIPAFSGGEYLYSPALPPGIFSKITALFDDSIKRRTLFFSFYSFGFLPLFYPPFWFLLFQDFLIRFVPFNSNLRWDLGLHYNAQISPLLALSSLFSLRVLKKHKLFISYSKVFAVLLIVNSILLHRFVLRGPLGLAYNPAFYPHTKSFRFLDELVAKIPKDKSIMTQNNIAVRFTHQEVYLLRERYIDYKPEYILIDARVGQNPNNFYGVGNYEDLLRLVTGIKGDRRYELIYNEGDEYIFKKTQEI